MIALRPKRDFCPVKITDDEKFCSKNTAYILKRVRNVRVWLTPDDLGKLSNRRIYDSSRKITEKGLNSCGTSITPPNSIVLSTRAPIGHIGITNIPSCTNQGCRTIVLDLMVCDVNCVYYLLYSQKEELQSLGQGSTFTELSSQKLKEFKIPFPPLLEQQAITSYLDQEAAKIDTLIAKTEQQIERLQKYRMSLISDAVTGKIDVRDTGDYVPTDESVGYCHKSLTGQARRRPEGAT